LERGNRGKWGGIFGWNKNRIPMEDIDLEGEEL